MLVKIEKKILENAVAVAAKAAAGLSVQPILKSLLLKTDQGQMYITGTDLILGIEKCVDAEVQEPGAAVAEAKLLLDIIRKLPDGTVTLKCDGQKLVISGGRAKLSLLCMKTEQFPAWPVDSAGYDTRLSIPQKKLKQAIAGTAFAAAEDASNMVMNSMHFEADADRITLTALDGYRIARKYIFPENGQSFPVSGISAIIQTKTLKEIMKSLDDGDVDISFTDKHVIFELKDKREVYVSVLVDGNYFNVDSLISTRGERILTVNKQELIDVIDRTTLFFNSIDKNPAILELSRPEILKTRMESRMGDMEEELEVTDSKYEELAIGVNPLLFLPILKSIDDEELEIEVSGSRTPLIMRGPEYLYLLLPVSIGR